MNFSSDGLPHLDSGRSKRRDRDSGTHRTCASASVAVRISECKRLDVWEAIQSLGSLDWPTQPTRSVRWARRPAGRGARPPPDAWRSCCAARLTRARVHAPFTRHASRHLTSARPFVWETGLNFGLRRILAVVRTDDQMARDRDLRILASRTYLWPVSIRDPRYAYADTCVIPMDPISTISTPHDLSHVHVHLCTFHACQHMGCFRTWGKV